MRLLDNPTVRERLAQALAGMDIHTPWRTHESADPGCVFDARGDEVLVVDPHNRLTDTQACSVANLVCIAVNVCAVRAKTEECVE